VTFSNTGTLALGATDGTQTYAGGISASSPSATTLKGTINSTNSPMTFGAVTLGANTTLNTNASASTASITLGAVTGSSYNLTLSTGSSAAGASVTGTSFSGTGTLALEHIGGTTRFTEGVTAQALTVASSVDDLELLGATGTITNAVTFGNAGTLTLGASGGSQTYSNGLTAVAPSGITLNGSLILGGSSSLGDSSTAITLGSATTFSVNTGGTLTIAGAVGGGNTNLTIGGVGNTAISSSIATGSGTLTKSGAGALTLSANNSFTGATTINGGIVVIHADAALGTISTLNAAAITLNNGALQASETFTLDSNRGITLGSSGGGLAASATKTLSYGGVITGNTPLTINGAGQTGSVILTGVNGASTITISAGSLQVGSGGSTNALGSGAITNNGNLVFNLSGAQTISQAISGTGTVEFVGPGAYTLSGTNSYQGLTTLTSGTLIVTNASALGSSGQGITVNGGILDLQADIGSEPIILNGGSIATSSGSGAFSGALTLSTNTSFDVAGGTLTISGVISETGGSRSFTKTGNGILILSNANTYSGGTIVSAGILQAGRDSSGSPVTSGPFGTGLITVDSGGAIDLYGKTIGNALNLSGSYGANVGALTNSVTSNQGVASGAVTLAANASVGGAGSILMSGVITGSAKLTLIGSATVTLSAANDSTFSGAVTVDSGVLSVGADTNLGANTGRFTLNGGALLANASFTLHANRALTMTAASGLQAASGSTLTYLGDISGSTYALTINGNSQTGTVVLGGNNTYGNTTLSGGTARIASNTALGSIGTISFAGGTLQYTSAYTADHSARFSNAANQAYAIDTNGETVTLATALTSSGGTFVKTGTGNLIFAADQTYTGSTTISAGTLTLGAGGTVGSVAGHIVNNSVLQLNRSDSQTYAGNISGSGSVSKLGSNALTLTGDQTYSGITTISGGALIIRNNAPSLSTSTYSGSGSLTIEPVGTSFSSALTVSGITFDSTLAGVTLGKSSNTSNLTLSSAINIAGPVTLYGDTITINSAISTQSTNAINVVAATTVDLTSGASLTSSSGAINVTGGTGYIYIRSGSGDVASSTNGTITFTATPNGNLSNDHLKFANRGVTAPNITVSIGPWNILLGLKYNDTVGLYLSDLRNLRASDTLTYGCLSSIAALRVICK
jgi:fibronectin-binding autotransporter adhesin